MNMESTKDHVVEIELTIKVIKYHTCDIRITLPYKTVPSRMMI